MLVGMTHPLRIYRETHEVTAEALARSAATTAATISRIERGQRLPSAALMARLVVATHGKVRADDFLPDTNTRKSAASREIN
jgi:transcriptional regulator with XRE-family HTH domain